jgi:hypothetical protein
MKANDLSGVNLPDPVAFVVLRIFRLLAHGNPPQAAFRAKSRIVSRLGHNILHADRLTTLFRFCEAPANFIEEIGHKDYAVAEGLLDRHHDGEPFLIGSQADSHHANSCS